MNYNFEKIHEEILEKSLKYKYIKNQILINQVLKLEKTKLDLFSFVMKSIISQQISDKAADTIWKRYCFHFENNNMKIKNITDKKKFSYSLDFLQISKRKKKSKSIRSSTKSKKRQFGKIPIIGGGWGFLGPQRSQFLRWCRCWCRFQSRACGS